jgi:hypothetical protein
MPALAAGWVVELGPDLRKSSAGVHAYVCSASIEMRLVFPICQRRGACFIEKPRRIGYSHGYPAEEIAARNRE